MISIENDSVFVSDGKFILEMKYIADEFVWMINNDSIIIDCSNSILYDELCRIMNNNYFFQNNIPCYKDNNKLIWLSDQYCDIEDKDSLSRINRLMIERRDDKFYIKVYNPFFEKNNIKRLYYTIIFSPLFNGYYSKNIDSGLSLQDDFCLMYQRLLRSKKHVLN